MSEMSLKKQKIMDKTFTARLYLVDGTTKDFALVYQVRYDGEAFYFESLLGGPFKVYSHLVGNISLREAEVPNVATD